ncbi:M23 family metallopeptidase [Pedosphaera parvula]|uniref:Peptidase M23 n=1 Tax=Pedosphaera parvula (strain Ellin514) TaxID=320771 RepID=B9XN41_PEDPL|nr:M23 family metallopeptidase [Pedosphaera parvula]EEF58703.1 Peptidase M23 [Pedosphaera parvula Ellin514]
MTFDLINKQRNCNVRTTRWITLLGSFWGPLLTVLLCSFGGGVSHAEPMPGKMLKIFTKEEGGLTRFYVQNLEAAEVTATFDMKMLNMKASTNFPFTAVFPGNQTVEAFTMTPGEKGAPWNYSYSDCFTIGSTTAVHDDSYMYTLPYAAGSSFPVSQGYHGSFSHSGPDEYAVDFKMPIGTPIHAARGGIVVKARGDSNVGGPDRKYENSANCVLIQHSDGTIGIYAHLMKGGVTVNVGDKVNAGDLIAHSGNTGFTSGPHLHFSVFKTRSGRERLSLPVRFRTAKESGLTLAAGQSYKAAAPEIQEVKANIPVGGEDKKKLGS